MAVIDFIEISRFDFTEVPEYELFLVSEGDNKVEVFDDYSSILLGEELKESKLYCYRGYSLCPLSQHDAEEVKEGRFTGTHCLPVNEKYLPEENQANEI